MGNTGQHWAARLRAVVYNQFEQVGAKMGKSTQPVYWGRTVKTGRTVVGDMLQ